MRGRPSLADGDMCMCVCMYIYIYADEFIYIYINPVHICRRVYIYIYIYPVAGVHSTARLNSANEACSQRSERRERERPTHLTRAHAPQHTLSRTSQFVDSSSINLAPCRVDQHSKRGAGEWPRLTSVLPRSSGDKALPAPNPGRGAETKTLNPAARGGPGHVRRV